MLTSILNLDGVEKLVKKQQITIKGGSWNTPNGGGDYFPNKKEEKDDGCGSTGCH